jgi:energy-converting hydrogenase Eha subunit G
MNPSDSEWLFMLAEVDATTAGRFTGGMIAVVLLLAGALKCWSISRRPTTNRKCVLALMFLLTGWALLSFGGLMARLFPDEWYLALILGLPAGALVIAGFVLAIIGLIEYSQRREAFTQGRAQAIWTLVLSVLMLGMFVARLGRKVEIRGG